MRRSVVKLATVVVAVVLLLLGCSPSEALSMPDVVGKRLDVALSDVQRAGISQEVEVLGGGTFGIIDEANWTVCSQDPASGAAVSVAPRVTVARTCEGTPSATSTSDSGMPDRTSSANHSTTPSDDLEAGADEGADRVTRYGQTAPFTAYASGQAGEPVSLEIAVTAPTRFTSKDPTYATQAASVYFTVTIRNTGKREFEAEMLGEKAISGLGTKDPEGEQMAGHGTDGDYIPDIAGEISGVDGSPEIEPGKSLRYKIGFSVANADDVAFTMRPYGLGGDTLYWTK